MYYRYEIRWSDDEPWHGICASLNPSERRKFNRFLREPVWYSRNPGVESSCWLTEYGYEKYHTSIEQILDDMALYRSAEQMAKRQVRLRKEESLLNVVVRGKVQCISLNR